MLSLRLYYRDFQDPIGYSRPPFLYILEKGPFSLRTGDILRKFYFLNANLLRGFSLSYRVLQTTCLCILEKCLFSLRTEHILRKLTF